MITRAAHSRYVVCHIDPREGDQELGTFRLARDTDGEMKAYAVQLGTGPTWVDAKFLLSLARYALSVGAVPVKGRWWYDALSY